MIYRIQLTPQELRDMLKEAYEDGYQDAATSDETPVAPDLSLVEFNETVTADRLNHFLMGKGFGPICT